MHGRPWFSMNLKAQCARPCYASSPSVPLSHVVPAVSSMPSVPTTVPCVHAMSASTLSFVVRIQDFIELLMIWLRSLIVFSSYATSFVVSTTIADIQGPAFRTPLLGQAVHNVTGLVTAKGSSGFYVAGERVPDIRISNGLSIFTTSTAILSQVTVGDMISFSGTVTEFRSSTAPNDLSLTEIQSPSNIVVLSSGNPVTPLILGKDRSPPTQQLSALDIGPDGFLSFPGNVSQVGSMNATLQPESFGMDFWESLEGQLVTIPQPIAIDFQNNFGEFWVYGAWPVTGKNSRGGLTITFGPDGIPDANPETVIIGSPLDKTKNPKVAVGFGLSDITGVVTYQFGFFYVLPLTAPSVISTPSMIVPPTTLSASTYECVLTFGDYNVENMAPTSTHLPTVASHIAMHLRTPDIMFVQEIQDNSGPTDDGTVLANITLTNLVNAIANISGVTYEFIEIAPIDGQDGGQPGGNIRQAYLYRPEKLSLVPGSPIGTALDETQIIGEPGNPALSFNPGRIKPSSDAWNISRKPLVANWQTPSGHQLFTINVHLASKGGSSSTQGDARPPVNSPTGVRASQVGLIAEFVGTILDKDENANILLAGDFNEYLQTRSVYAPLVVLLTDIDEPAGIPAVERYSYVFDQNSEQLDHAFISNAIKAREPEFEHIHVNNWSPTLTARVSDHDPSVGRIKVC